MKQYAALSVIQVAELPVSATARAAGTDRLAPVSPTTQPRRRMAAPVLAASPSLCICWLWFLGFYSVSLLGISGLMVGLHLLLDVI